MANVLLCSHDPMLLRGLEYPLRDAGHSVTSTPGAAQGVRLVLDGSYDVVLFDADGLGMSAAEAVAILGRVAPATRALVAGETVPGRGPGPRGGLEEIKAAILGAAQPQHPAADG